MHKTYDGYYKYDDAVAASYDSDRIVEHHWHKEIAYVQTFFATTLVDRVLDLPVGTGRFLHCFKHAKEIVGIDISESMIEKAKERSRELQIERICSLKIGDARELGEKDGCFDATIVVRLLHLIPDEILPLLISEICRVSSGVILVQSYSTKCGSVGSALGKLRLNLAGLLGIGKRLISRTIGLRKKATSKSNLEESCSLPWGHITAYYRPASEIDKIFSSKGWKVRSSDVVDRYGDLDVRFTTYSR